MNLTPRQLPDPVPDPGGAFLAASVRDVWESKTGTVIETSRKLPHPLSHPAQR